MSPLLWEFSRRLAGPAVRVLEEEVPAEVALAEVAQEVFEGV